MKYFKNIFKNDKNKVEITSDRKERLYQSKLTLPIDKYEHVDPFSYNKITKHPVLVNPYKKYESESDSTSSSEDEPDEQVNNEVVKVKKMDISEAQERENRRRQLTGLSLPNRAQMNQIPLNMSKAYKQDLISRARHISSQIQRSQNKKSKIYETKLTKPLKYYSSDSPHQPSDKYGNFPIHYGGPVNFSRYYKAPFRGRNNDPGYFYGDLKGLSGSALFKSSDYDQKNYKA